MSGPAEMQAGPESAAAGEARREESWRTLWLPLAAPGPVWAATAALALAYLATMCRDLSFYDSGEFALVAVQGGLSHPPGHPLHTLLGWLLAHIPGLPPLLGLNALSALPAALALVPLASLAEGLLPGRGARLERWGVPAALAALALHPALWEVASRIEVYALAGFLALWAAAKVAAMLGAGRRGAARWLAPGLALGLTASVNPIIAVAAALSLAPGLVSALRRRLLGPGGALALVGGGLLGLLPYLYVPLVAGRQGAFVWGAPGGGEALRRFVTFADFAHNRPSSMAEVAEHALEWLPWAAEQGLLPLLVLGLVAHVLWGRGAGLGRAAAPTFLGLALLFIWRNGVYYPDVADYLGYLMAPLSLLGAGLVALLLRLARSGGRRVQVLAGLLAGALLLVVLLSPPPLHGRTRRLDRVARVLAAGALERAPRGAVVIVESDHWVFPMMYLQEAEGLRPDVVVLARGLSGASWFWGHLLERHGELQGFELRGPGGQPARIGRFLAANPGRPVLYEGWRQALSLGHLPACAGAWLIGDRLACERGGGEVDELTRALERESAVVGQGSPTTDAVIAEVALRRGEALWRLGRVDEAVRALRAGVPPELRPAWRARPLAAVPPPRGPLPPWRAGVAIGHYSRDLYLAALLLGHGGDEEAARAHLRAAAEAGLAEALEP